MLQDRPNAAGILQDVLGMCLVVAALLAMAGLDLKASTLKDL